MRTYKHIRFLFWYISACLLLGGFLLEAILRFFYPPPYALLLTNKYNYVQDYGFYDEGVFGRGFLERKTPETKRILFLGDSFIASDSFTSVFSSIVHNNHRPYDIKKLASNGWGTDQEYLAFKNIGKKYRPDIVILAFCLWNDFSNNLSIFHEENQIKPYFILNNKRLTLYTPDGLKNFKDKKSLAVRAHYWCYKHIRTYYYLSKTLSLCCHVPLFTDKANNLNGDYEGILPSIPERFPFMLTNRISHYLQFIKEPRPIICFEKRNIDIQEYGYELMFTILAELQKEVTSYGGRFYLFILPFANPYNWDNTHSSAVVTQADGQKVVLDYLLHINKLKEHARAYGIPVIDITNEMQQQYQSGRNLIYGNNNVHYNEKGKQFVGKTLAEYFLTHIEPQEKSE
jgi:hypothetical protein